MGNLIELYACRKPNTNLYKPNRDGFPFGEPLGNKIRLYKSKRAANEFKREFTEVVKLRLEVVDEI